MKIGAGAKLTGFGTVTANIATGSGTITASGGTLDLSGTVASGDTFVIAAAAASVLEFTNTATAATAIAINNANQTLEIGAGGALTIGAAESITIGTILLAGGTLTDCSGLTFDTGATLSGFGTVAAPINTGSGTITASGGTLDLTGTVASGDTFVIAAAAASVLEFAGTATTPATASGCGQQCQSDLGDRSRVAT